MCQPPAVRTTSPCEQRVRVVSQEATVKTNKADKQRTDDSACALPAMIRSRDLICCKRVAKPSSMYRVPPIRPHHDKVHHCARGPALCMPCTPRRILPRLFSARNSGPPSVLLPPPSF
ncbi:hypothetical protein HYQ46_003519 [Verticillium longisporum]|nr:hypothetical protein HYQ46_003519 [Verticillium longisporum]